MSTANKKNDGFGRFKKKLRRNAWIKSLLFGVSCGLLAAAGIIIYQKMTTVSPQLLLYLPIGAGVALLTGLLAFLVLRPSIKKIARRLDNELMLGEKVQTMLEYQDSQEDMLILQREDANEKLMNQPPELKSQFRKKKEQKEQQRLQKMRQKLKQIQEKRK